MLVRELINRCVTENIKLYFYNSSYFNENGKYVFPEQIISTCYEYEREYDNKGREKYLEFLNRAVEGIGNAEYYNYNGGYALELDVFLFNSDKRERQKDMTVRDLIQVLDEDSKLNIFEKNEDGYVKLTSSELNDNGLDRKVDIFLASKNADDCYLELDVYLV